MDDKLMTVSEFRSLTRRWAIAVENASRLILMHQTHSSTNLARFLTSFVDSINQNEPPYKIKFHFERYGVFRAYGAGRGYVIINGRITKGHRIWSLRDQRRKKFTSEALMMKKAGYKLKDIKKAKLTWDSLSIKRTPLNWMDSQIDSHIDILADAVQEYYGDKALQGLANALGKGKIIKNG